MKIFSKEIKNVTLISCQLCLIFSLIVFSSTLAEETYKSELNISVVPTLKSCSYNKLNYTKGAICYTGNYRIYEPDERMILVEYNVCKDEGWESGEKPGMPGERTLCEGGIGYVGEKQTKSNVLL